MDLRDSPSPLSSSREASGRCRVDAAAPLGGPGRQAVCLAPTPRPQRTWWLVAGSASSPDGIGEQFYPPPGWETRPPAARFSSTASTILYISPAPDRGPRALGRGALMPSSLGTVQAAGKERRGGRRRLQRQNMAANYDNEPVVGMLPWQRLPRRRAAQAAGPQPQVPGAVTGAKRSGRPARDLRPCSPGQGGGRPPGE